MNICANNLDNRYFIGLDVVHHPDAASGCHSAGYEIANLQAFQIPALMALGQGCVGANQTFYFNAFEAMPAPFDCWYFNGGNGTVGSYSQVCVNTHGYAVCELLPLNITSISTYYDVGEFACREFDLYDRVDRDDDDSGDEC